jgi:hypothetical protein
MNLKIPDNLIHAAFFFIDIVGLSSPDMSTNTQTQKIKVLNKIIAESEIFRSISKEHKLVLPTGDGMAIGFLTGLEHPLNLAKDVQQKLVQYNEEKLATDKIFVRIGCHSGNVFVVDDIYGNKNFWGPGIILARRVMDIGDGGHILMTSSMAESLLELSDEYKKIIHPIHDYQIKHKEIILLYSVYDDTFGNPSKPEKGLRAKPKLLDEAYETRKTIDYEHIEFSLTLKDQNTNLVESNRIYRLINNSEEPIYEVPIGIITNIEKSFNELKVIASDERGNELQIKSINVDSPLRKEFSIKLNEPVFQGQTGRLYSVKYESEEPGRFFENLFLLNSKKLTVQFTYPTENKMKKPNLFIIRHQDREKKLLDSDPNIKQGVSTTMKWDVEMGINEKDIIRLEW